MKKNTKYSLVIVGVFLLIFIILLTSLLVKRVTKNPPGTIGNTAGNIYNDGLFCEYNGVVYFSNAAEGGSLYSMNVDESNPRLLRPQKTRNILAGGDYLYYFHSGSSKQSGFGQVQGMKSFARCRLNGKDFTSLTSDVVVSAQLVDNYLYLLTNSNSNPTLIKMNTDKSNLTVLGKEVIDPACARDGKIYFNGTADNHYLHCLDTSTDSVAVVWKGNLWYPVLIDDYIYYLDVANNYRLCRYNMSAHEINVLTNERVDCFNVGNGYIYYQTNSTEPALKCMYTDGSNCFVVAEGIYTDINLTSRYAYFKPFGEEGILYHSSLGTTGMSLFSPH